MRRGTREIIREPETLESRKPPCEYQPCRLTGAQREGSPSREANGRRRTTNPEALRRWRSHPDRSRHYRTFPHPRRGLHPIRRIGEAHTPQEVLNELKSGAIRYVSMVSTGRRIRLLSADVAIVHGSEEDDVEQGGQRFPVSYVYMDGVVKRSGMWQIVASQLARPSQPPPVGRLTMISN
jgi:hypothetical protein